MRTFLRRRYGAARGPLHMGHGVSVEDGSKKGRIRHLQDAPAGVRFLSVEPLIGPMGTLDLRGIDWVIVGGESGPAARHMNPDWVREVRDQCLESGVAFFFKQVRSPGVGHSIAGNGVSFQSFRHLTPSQATDMVSLSD